MTNEEIFNSLKEIISMLRPNVDLDNVTPLSALLEDLGLDSLTMLLMSLAIEKKFGISFNCPGALTDVQSVVNYISAQIA